MSLGQRPALAGLPELVGFLAHDLAVLSQPDPLVLLAEFVGHHIQPEVAGGCVHRAKLEDAAVGDDHHLRFVIGQPGQGGLGGSRVPVQPQAVEVAIPVDIFYLQAVLGVPISDLGHGCLQIRGQVGLVTALVDEGYDLQNRFGLAQHTQGIGVLAAEIKAVQGLFPVIVRQEGQ